MKAKAAFLKLSPLHRAHELAAEYHRAANIVNVGTAALLESGGKEAEEFWLQRGPGRQQVLPKYKHIDVACNELKALQHLEMIDDEADHFGIRLKSRILVYSKDISP